MAQASRALVQSKKLADELSGRLIVRDARIAELEQLLEERNQQLQGKVLENDQLQLDGQELKEQNAALGDQLEASTKRSRELMAERDTARTNATIADKDRKATEADNDNLRDELHRLTVENARLQGYHDRVKEFDPVTEAEEYKAFTERQRGSFHLEGGRPFRHYGTAFRDRVSGGFAEYAGDGMMSVNSQRPSWYRRG